MRREQDTKCPNKQPIFEHFLWQAERERNREREREAGIANTAVIANNAVLSASESGRHEGGVAESCSQTWQDVTAKKRHLDADRNHRPLDYVWRIWCFQQGTNKQYPKEKRCWGLQPQNKNIPKIIIYIYMIRRWNHIERKNQSMQIFWKSFGLRAHDTYKRYLYSWWRRTTVCYKACSPDSPQTNSRKTSQRQKTSAPFWFSKMFVRQRSMTATRIVNMRRDAKFASKWLQTETQPVESNLCKKARGRHYIYIERERKRQTRKIDGKRETKRRE